MAKIHIGTMGWSYDFWVANFYPKDTKRAEFLAEYAKQFDTVEVNATFYRIPSKGTLSKWRAQTPDQFLFSAKFPRKITHQKMLADCEEETGYFLERLSALGQKMGPLVLQLPQQFRLGELNLLKDFLAALPNERRFVVEVRNRSLLEERFYSILTERNVALALTDRLFSPATVRLTSDFAYVRWEGDRTTVNGTLGRVEVDRLNDIKAWADTIRGFSDIDIEAFGYFSKYFSGYPPTDVRTLLKILNRTAIER